MAVLCPQQPVEHQSQSKSQSGHAAMSSGPVTALDVQRVHYLIELCIVRSLSKLDTIELLRKRMDIDTGLTQIVWQKLEEQNPEFFLDYNMRQAMGSFNCLSLETPSA